MMCALRRSLELIVHEVVMYIQLKLTRMPSYLLQINEIGSEASAANYGFACASSVSMTMVGRSS